MITVSILLSSLFIFSLQLLLYQKYEKMPHHKNLSGYEIARYILNSGGFSEIPIDILTRKAQPFFSGSRQLYLERKIYEGNSLLAVALAAKEASEVVSLSQGKTVLEMKNRFRKILAGWTLAGWLLWMAGVFLPGLGFLTSTGSFAVLAVFFVGLINLPFSWEASERTLNFLKKSHLFTVHELVRFKGLLNFMRFACLAQIFNIPFGAIKNLMARKEKAFHGI